MSAVEVVVDASLALKWVVEEAYSREARTLLEQWGNHRRKLLAPALFLYEIADALAKRMQRRQFTLEAFPRFLRRTGITRIPPTTQDQRPARSVGSDAAM